jgi:nucleoside-diphosphate-sugar epimerase
VPVRPEGRPRIDGVTVLVTGAGGFIGSAVVEALVARGAHVRALAAAPGQPVRELPPEVAAVFADIEDGETLARMAAGAEVAIHLAGPPSVHDSFRSPLEHARVHAGGTVALLEACRTAGVPRFVYVSSAEVYGHPDVNPVPEGQPLDPRSPYAAGKAAAEQFVRAYGYSFGMQPVVLRPFSVYGPRLRPQSVLATILRQALHDDEIVLADLAPVRDYCFLDDVVEGILSAASAPRLADPTFNLGSGTGTSVGELAALALRLAGRDVPIRADPCRRRPAGTDVARLVADRRRAEAVLGWTPAVHMEDGVCRTIAWMKAQP